MDDVRVEPLDPSDEAGRAWPVLEPFGRDPQARAAEEPRGDRGEKLLALVALGLGRLAVGEARGEKRDRMAELCQRRGERVVVWRRVGERVDEGDAHQTRDRR